MTKDKRVNTVSTLPSSLALIYIKRLDFLLMLRFRKSHPCPNILKNLTRFFFVYLSPACSHPELNHRTSVLVVQLGP